MALGDARDVSEIRQGGDEMSVLNAYTEHHLGTSQPGLTAEQRGETASEDESWKLTANEDDPRWYEDDSSDSWDEEESPDFEPASTAGQIDTSGIAEQVAHDWARAQLDPNTAMAQEFVGAIDQRIQAQLNAVREAEQWAAQGRMEREQRDGIRDAQHDMNVAAEGEAQLAQIAQAAATYHGVPQSDPEALHAEANSLFEQAALNFVNNGGSPEDWQNAQQAVAAACVTQATVNLGRQQMSDNALKTFASPSQWRMAKERETKLSELAAQRYLNQLTGS